MALVFLVILKHTTRQTWTPPATPVILGSAWKEDRNTLVKFLSNGRILIGHRDKATGETRGELLHIKEALYGVHYIGGLWNIDGRTELAWIDDGSAPVRITYSALGSMRNGVLDRRSPAVTDDRAMTLYFGGNRIKYDDEWPVPLPYHAAEVEAVLAKFEEAP